MSIKKRLLLGAGALGTVGALAALVAGVTFGLFSATTPAATSSPAFTAGTVTLNQSESFTCTFTVSNTDTNGGNLAPGDHTANYGVKNPGTGSPCSFPVSYTGSVSAYLGLDVSYTSTPAASCPAPYGGTAPTCSGLYTPTDAPSTLNIQVVDGNNNPATYAATDSLLFGSATLGTAYSNSGGTATQLPTSSGTPAESVTDLLLAGPSGASTYGPGNVTAVPDTLYVDVSLPSGVGNSYQGSSVTLTFLVHAVQSAHNSNTCTIDHQCSAGGGFAWS